MLMKSSWLNVAYRRKEEVSRVHHKQDVEFALFFLGRLRGGSRIQSAHIGKWPLKRALFMLGADEIIA